jgi:hemolysin D
MIAGSDVNESARKRELAFRAPELRASDQALVEFESPSAGLIAAPPIKGAPASIWIAATMLIAIVAFSGIIPINIVVTATGKVVSQDPTLVVAPYNQAIVRSIEVTNGQLVHKGDLLARLDPTFAAADLKSYESQVASYQAQIDRDKAEAEGKPYVSSANNPATRLQAALYSQNMADRNFKLEGYRQQINALELQIARDAAQAAYYRQRLQVASDLQSMNLQAQRLFVGSQLDSLLAIDNRLEITRMMAQIAATAESEKRDLQHLLSERESYDKEWYASVLADVQTTQPLLDQAMDNLKKAQLNTQLVELRAEQDAIVTSIAPVSVGSVMQPGQQFFTLAPADGKYEVEANVVGNDAGMVREGDPVVIKFDSYPYILYGYATGKVTVVAADSFYQYGTGVNGTASTSNPMPKVTPGTGGQIVPSPTDAVPGATAYYLDRVSLDKVKLHNVPHDFRIVPGMPTTSDIKVGRRSVFGYLVSRVLPMSDDSCTGTHHTPDCDNH